MTNSLDKLLEKNIKKIREKIDQLEVQEGDTLVVYVYLWSKDIEYLHNLREKIHDVLDELKFFDINVEGRPKKIHIDDAVHDHGDVEVTIEQREDVIFHLDKL